MHTISETAYTSDVLAAVHVMKETILAMDAEDDLRTVFRQSHPHLDNVTAITHQDSARPEAPRTGKPA